MKRTARLVTTLAVTGGLVLGATAVANAATVIKPDTAKGRPASSAVTAATVKVVGTTSTHKKFNKTGRTVTAPKGRYTATSTVTYKVTTKRASTLRCTLIAASFDGSTLRNWEGTSVIWGVDDVATGYLNYTYGWDCVNSVTRMHSERYTDSVSEFGSSQYVFTYNNGVPVTEADVEADAYLNPGYISTVAGPTITTTTTKKVVTARAVRVTR